MILIIDFGSQFTQLVARRIRELSIYSEIVSFKNAKKYITTHKIHGIILSGGPHSVYEANAPQLDLNLEEIDVPVLGICYGFHLINKILGGKVAPSKSREYGFETIAVEKNLAANNPLYNLQGKPPSVVWMSHGDEVQELSSKCVVDSYTRSGVIGSFYHTERPIFGVQFHPEVEHSKCGREILEHFATVTCQSPKDWQSDSQIESAVKKIKDTIDDAGENAVAICALSGGVDSCVAAVLAQRAIGNKLRCLFINNGLLRKNEYEDVLARFKKDLNLNVKGIDASQLFLSRLAGVTDPEQKRKIIGKTFIDVFEAEVSNIQGDSNFLIQGTLYPDVIESVSLYGTSVTIKTHHNVGGLPEKMKFKLIEPLRELFKDEVRKIGAALGIPADMLARHPFPGPGLGIRVLGEVTQERLAIVREADAIFIDELKKNNLYLSTWQAFVVLLPVNSVGVMGDGRTYENVAAIRAVNATDGMTAEWTQLPYEFLAHVSSRIINEVKGINRVVYDISTKPPATIEWE